jgi:lipopolysaccharide transport system permease protein
LNLRELWAYREVLHALVWREINIRYAQAAVGVGWVVLQPVLTTVVLSLVAGRWMGAAAGGVPYPLFSCSGLVPWLYFTHVLTKSSICMVGTGLLSKAYFPRLLLPLATAAGGLIDLLVASAVLAVLMFYYGSVPGPGILLLPVGLVLLITTALGAGIWLSVLNLFHRDIAHALPFGTQLLFFLTPVAYPAGMISESWRPFYSLNPMVAVIECLRYALFGIGPGISTAQIAASVAVGMLVLVSGLVYFRRHERTLADVGDT